MRMKLTARADWNLTSERISKSPEGLDLPALLDRIESDMGDTALEAQWTMNYCLAGIGIHFPKHRKRAIGIGESLASIATTRFPRVARHRSPLSGSTRW
jgi:hypothetical protein